MVFLPLGALDKESAFSLVTSPMKEIHIKWKDENMISKKSNEEVNFENNFFDFYYRKLICLFNQI